MRVKSGTLAGVGVLLLIVVGSVIFLNLFRSSLPNPAFAPTRTPITLPTTVILHTDKTTPSTTRPDPPLAATQTPVDAALATSATLPPPSPTSMQATPPPTPTQVALPTGSPTYGVFEGITPCDDIPRPLPQIPLDTNCEAMIWKITLYQDPQTGTSTTYRLNAAYGVAQPNTTGLRGGGTRLELEGKWSVSSGTKTDPDALVYQLSIENPQAELSLLKLDDNILHVLTGDRRPMIGNGGWSYTLNRTQPAPADASQQVTDVTPGGAAPTAPSGLSTRSVFEGRTPCNEVVLELAKVAPGPDCTRIKMRLTLNRDPETGIPTTYLWEGTSTSREGAWTIARGTRTDPDALVYQLDLGNPKALTYLLSLDDDILLFLDRDRRLLVGDKILSYTLSKVDKP